MSGTISKVIIEYYQLVDERNKLKNENQKLREALALTNSMILSGERHSEESKLMIDSALLEK